MDTITVKLAKGKNFTKGLKYAKKFGGKYNPQSKTWTIPTHRNNIYNTSLNAPQLYGLIPVTSTQCDCPSGQMGGACTCC